MRDAEHVTQTAALLGARAAHLDLTQGSHVAARDALELHRIATRLHRFDERNCCEDLTCPRCQGDGVVFKPARSQSAHLLTTQGENVTCKACAGRGHTLGRREARNEERARELAGAYNMVVYFQGDCRGCPLYLLPKEQLPNERNADLLTLRYPHETEPPTHEKLVARWIAAHYNSRGVAVCHLGR